MKIIIILALGIHILLGADYMAKIEPLYKTTIKSEIMGVLQYVNLDKEYTNSNNSVLIAKLDTSTIDEEIKFLKKQLKNQKRITKIQQIKYKSKKAIALISKYEKLQEELLMRNAKQSLYNLQKELNIKLIKRKKYQFYANNTTIGKIYVAQKQFINIGTKIFDEYHTSNVKLNIYLKYNEYKNIKDKNIYIDNNQSKCKISYISNIPDEKYITLYKTQILCKNRGLYPIGKIVKVEFK